MQRFQTIANVSRDLVWVCDAAGDNIFVNARWFEYTGQTIEEAKGFGWAAAVHPDDATRVLPSFERCRRTEQPYEGEVRIRRRDGEYRWHMFRALPERRADGAIQAWCGCSIDVHEAKVDVTECTTREAHDQFLLRLHEAIRPLSDPGEMQDVTARLLGEHLRVNRVLYAAIDGEEFEVTRCYVNGVAPLRGRGSLLAFGATLREAGRRGESVAVSDIRTDPRFSDAERATHLASGIVAFAGAVLHKQGRWVAAFGVHNATPRVWTRDELALVEETAERMWSASEQARAVTALREREARLRMALEASAAGSWTRDVNADHVDWDDGLRRLYGFAPDEPITFDKWLGCICEEDRAKVLELVDGMRHPTKDAWDSVFRIVRPDGTVAWIQSIGRVERDAAGEAVRLAGLELDVTARRQSEEAQKARRDEEHNRELRILLETASQGIVSVDAQGRILTANRALEGMFGWSSGELVGESIKTLVTSAFLTAPNPTGTSLALVGVRKDGSEFPIEVTVSRMATPRGDHAIAFVTDVTERRRATAELEQRTVQLRRLASDLTLAEQHAREQLARTLHDGLQQLLVTVSLNLEQVMQHEARGTAGTIGMPGLDDPLVQARARLDEAIAAARSLSYELFPPVLHRSGLPAAFAWLADWTRQQYGLHVEISADPLGDSTRKDVRTLLFESVRELLFNVVKHAHVARATVDLARTADGALSITVADQGIGFDPATLVDTGHAGWGLFSIRERLTLMGGRFEIDSAPGHGTRFHLIAPRGPSHDAIAAASPSSRAGVPTSPDPLVVGSPRRLRILIVDDHAPVRKALRGLLEARPEFQVAGEATNGVEAIVQAHAIKPDVILMDVSMPEMDGIEATQRLHAEAPSILIFGLSMQPRPQGRHAIEDAGAAGFFTKGVDTARLLNQLHAIHHPQAAGSITVAR